MGFRLNRTYRLVFAGDLEGFEVVIRGTSLAVLDEISKANIDELAELLASYVVEWNYEDEAGQTLPIEPASFFGLEKPVLIAIADAWIQAGIGITAPLDLGSTDGEQSEEPPIPMIPTEAL